MFDEGYLIEGQFLGFVILIKRARLDIRDWRKVEHNIRLDLIHRLMLVEFWWSREVKGELNIKSGH